MKLIKKFTLLNLMSSSSFDVFFNLMLLCYFNYVIFVSCHEVDKVKLVFIFLFYYKL